ncbi:DNA-binding transcriptional ArsR family regulator [Desulfosalsimonas propionicica]|uniref:DNA-binding transcriptional ArsR family regulator n=1 Tax=Desulfosalsimonas propionicica TaxID=332175 RepID=A0A7W0CAI8_9BACT|nr:metalloregulator ArsR/SmtB family transcription factor [Desulfosalsimonas propionicica]MBA2882194.1 DNA-binding transcriptional ArsR family regulator [Desulfosalsimonas propionicica]
MPTAENAARIFKVLSVDTRVRMIDLLKTRTLCVNAMAKSLNISPAAVSQHLRILRDADIVIGEKRGYFVHYRVNEETLAKWHKTANHLLDPSPAKPFIIAGSLKNSNSDKGGQS